MVQLTPSETKNNNIREWPSWEWVLPQEQPMNLAVGKRTIKTEDVEEEIPLQKRLKSSSVQSTNEMNINNNGSLITQSLYNMLNGPGPLGLRMNNSQSFCDLVQAKVDHAHKKNGGKVVKPKDVKPKDVKPKDVVVGPVDKLKASNFPAVLLRIGQWEYASKYEADLVAKCYFAKHKLVWEVLDDKLKNKIEIQWGDIVGLKAHLPDDGPSSLTIVLGKAPLFFRETDPQPRKHTVWQATTDFTGGEASKYRMHYLQCSQGVLNKHYEKLIQCDTRLNFLSQQVDPFMGFPVAAKESVKDPNVMNNNGFKDPNVMKNNGFNQVDTSKGPVVSFHQNMGPLDLARGYVGRSGLVQSNLNGPVNMPGPQQPMYISQHCVLDNKPQVLPVYNNNNNMSVRLTTTSNEESLTPKVNSLVGFHQNGNELSNVYNNLDVGDYQSLEWGGGNDHFTPYGNLMPKNENGNGMTRVDSLTELLDQLPDIASLPRLAFDTSQDDLMMDFYSEAG